METQRIIAVEGGRILPQSTPVDAALLIEGDDYEIVETKTTSRRRRPTVQSWGEHLDRAMQSAMEWDWLRSA